MNFRTMKKNTIIIISLLLSTNTFSQYLYYDPSDVVPIYENDTLKIEDAIFYKVPILIDEYKLENEFKKPSWFDHVLFMVNPNLVEKGLDFFQNNISKNRLEELGNLERYEDYVSYIEKEVKVNLDLYKYLYFYLEVSIKHKLTNREFVLLVYEVSKNRLDELNYSYNNLNNEGFTLNFPIIFEVKNEDIVIPGDDGYSLIFPETREDQFGYNNNLRKLLESVPSYIESTKNADGTRVEKIVVNED